MGLHIHREPLTSDIIFKAVFGRDTPGSKRALIALLNRILERNEDPIVALDYQNPFSIGELEEEKEIIMDILVETSRGEQIDIEMQISSSLEKVLLCMINSMKLLFLCFYRKCNLLFLIL